MNTDSEHNVIKKHTRSFKRDRLTSSMRKKNEQRSKVLRRLSTVVNEHVQDNSSNSLLVIEMPSTHLSISSREDFNQSCKSNNQDFLSPVPEEPSRNGSSSSIPIAKKNQQNSKIQDCMRTVLAPTYIFPHTNRVHKERKRKTVEEESQQWETLYDPQYTFGSFNQGVFSSKNVAVSSPNDYFYKGKWPLEQEDITGLVSTRKQPSKEEGSNCQASLQSIRSSLHQSNTNLIPYPLEPDLPDIKKLESFIHKIVPATAIEQHNNDQNKVQKEPHGQDMVCSSEELSSSFIIDKNASKHEAKLWDKRLELLYTIRSQIFCKEWDGTVIQKKQLNEYHRKGSAASRFHRQLKHKAKKIKNEAFTASSSDEDGGKRLPISNNNTAVDERIDIVSYDDQECGKLLLNSSSSIFNKQGRFDDNHKKITFPVTTSREDIEQHAMKKNIIDAPGEIKSNRPGFLLFIFGFLFPPLWIFGALYVPRLSEETTSDSKRIDKKWRKYSRNAFLSFFVSAITIVVFIVVFKTDLIGFRRSHGEQSQHEEKIVFD
ncbi:MAG: hypothetical protein EXX96DRAFT_351856 [Benjaminiella poitrasii]|nr:MAG: hypothetical protein EXX96DRAFT_351856 [Benjaminiella poitrasii]